MSLSFSLKPEGRPPILGDSLKKKTHGAPQKGAPQPISSQVMDLGKILGVVGATGSTMVSCPFPFPPVEQRSRFTGSPKLFNILGVDICIRM